MPSKDPHDAPDDETPAEKRLRLLSLSATATQPDEAKALAKENEKGLTDTADDSKAASKASSKDK